MANAWRATYRMLPKVDGIDSQNAEQYRDAVQNLVTVFNSMSTYQQSFLTDDEKNGLAAYVAKLKEFGIEIQT